MLLLISTFKYQSSPTLVNGALSPPVVINIASSPLYATLLPFATSIGIDRVGSVSSATLNFTWAMPLIGGTRIGTTHSPQSSSLCDWLHLLTQFLTCALSMALPEFRLTGRSVSPLWIYGFEVCAYRGQTVCCTTEVCLSVNNWKKTTNKEGTM